MDVPAVCSIEMSTQTYVPTTYHKITQTYFCGNSKMMQCLILSFITLSLSIPLHSLSNLPSGHPQRIRSNFHCLAPFPEIVDKKEIQFLLCYGQNVYFVWKYVSFAITVHKGWVRMISPRSITCGRCVNFCFLFFHDTMAINNARQFLNDATLNGNLRNHGFGYCLNLCNSDRITRAKRCNICNIKVFPIWKRSNPLVQLWRPVVFLAQMAHISAWHRYLIRF